MFCLVWAKRIDTRLLGVTLPTFDADAHVVNHVAMVTGVNGPGVILRGHESPMGKLIELFEQRSGTASADRVDLSFQMSNSGLISLRSEVEDSRRQHRVLERKKEPDVVKDANHLFVAGLTGHGLVEGVDQSLSWAFRGRDVSISEIFLPGACPVFASRAQSQAGFKHVGVIG